MALAANRNTDQKAEDLILLPLADNVVVYLGALVVTNAGYARPGRTHNGDWAVGRAESAYIGAPGAGAPSKPGDAADNTQSGHAAGAVSVLVRRGVFKFANSGSDPVAQANVGALCFVVDDQTVSATDGGATQSVAGRVLAIDADGGVWVNFKDQAALAT